MNKLLMVLAAIFITVAASAQSGTSCCALKGTHVAAASVEPAPQAMAPATATAGIDQVALVTANTTDTEKAGCVPCPNRPGCVCPGGMKASSASAAPTAKAGGPCPSRPGCVCKP